MNEVSISCIFAFLVERATWAIDVAYNWQTLITGVLALGAAWWGVKKIQQQIDLQRSQLDLQKSQYESDQKHLEATKKSRSWAARAQLPDALSVVGVYAAACLQYVLEPGKNKMPDHPVEAMTSIKNAVEHADPVSAQAIYDLIVHFQIHNARLPSRQNPIRVQDELQLTYDSVHLRCLVDRLYEYARNEEDVVTQIIITYDMMLSALKSSFGVRRYAEHENEFLQLRQLISERHRGHQAA